MKPLPQYKSNPAFETDFELFLDLPGFFPGAGGFFHDCTPGFVKSFVFFGTDFGELSYQKTLGEASGEPRSNQTLRNLREIITQAGLDLNACLLTNAVLGLTKGEQAVGNYGSIFKNYPDYLDLCAHWHQETIDSSDARLVVLMGTPHIQDYGARIFPELGGIWAGHKSLKGIFSAGLELVKRACGPDILLMYHPSYWHLHPFEAKRRIVSHLRGYSGCVGLATSAAT